MKQIKSYVNTSRAQAVVLSEFRNNMSGLNLRHSMLLNGYRYQAVSSSKPDANSVIIASKLPFSSHIYSDLDPEYSGNVIRAQFPAFDLYGCYLPHKKKHQLFDFLVEESKSDRSIIITGDLNSGINRLDQEGSSFWYEDELKEIHSNGVVDAFRHIHGAELEYSWFSHKGNGYRYDHFLASEEILSLIGACEYDQKAREEGLSDHAPMFLELG